jgi:hypothetical protein
MFKMAIILYGSSFWETAATPICRLPQGILLTSLTVTAVVAAATAAAAAAAAAVWWLLPSFILLLQQLLLLLQHINSRDSMQINRHTFFSNIFLKLYKIIKSYFKLQTVIKRYKIF